MYQKLAIFKISDINFSLLKAKLFKKLDYIFVKFDSYSFYLKCVDLSTILLNVENCESTLIYLKNVKPTHSVSYKNTLSVFHNKNYIRKNGYSIIITKNIYKSLLKAMNNYLKMINLVR